MTSKGGAAFSKSLCVLYMHVWYTEFCGNCLLFSRVFPRVIVHLCVTKSHRTQISGWVCLRFCFSFSRDRSSSSLSSSSILKTQENLWRSRHMKFKQWFITLIQIKIQHPFPQEHCFSCYKFSYVYLLFWKFMKSMFCKRTGKVHSRTS